MSTDRLRMAEQTAEHLAEQLAFERAQLLVVSDLVWDVIIALRLAPEAEPEQPVVFGSWSVARILAAVQDHAIQGSGEAAGRAEGLVREAPGQQPGSVRSGPGAQPNSQGSPSGWDDLSSRGLAFSPSVGTDSSIASYQSASAGIYQHLDSTGGSPDSPAAAEDQPAEEVPDGSPERDDER